MEYEIWIKDGVPRLRKKPDRSIKAASKKRLLNLIKFSEAAHTAVNKKKKGKLPPAAEAVKKAYKETKETEEKEKMKLTIDELYQIMQEMLRRGVSTVNLPKEIEIEEEKEKIEQT